MGVFNAIQFYFSKMKVAHLCICVPLGLWNARTRHRTTEASHVRFLRHLRRWTTRRCLRCSYTGTAAIGRLTNRRGERTTAAIRHALLFSLLAHPPFIGLGV